MQISAVGISNEWCHLNWSLLFQLYVANIINSCSLDTAIEKYLFVMRADTWGLIWWLCFVKLARLKDSQTVKYVFVLLCCFILYALQMSLQRYHGAWGQPSQRVRVISFCALKLEGVKKDFISWKKTHKNKGGPDTLSHMFNCLLQFGK